MTPRRHLALGLLFLVALSVLGYYTLFRTEVSFLGERHRMTVFFDDASGLRKGSPVLVAGMRWGEVEGLTFDPAAPTARRVTAVLALDAEVPLFTDHAIVIEDASVLGGKQLSIEPGEPSTGAVAAGAELAGRSAPNFLASLGELVDENKDAISNTFAGLERLVDELESSDGTLSKLLKDEEMGRKLGNAIDAIESTFENTQALTEELRGGQGTFGKLIYDPELYDDIKGIVEGVDAFVEDGRGLIADARTGEGTVAALLNDPEVADDVRQALDSIRSTAGKIDRGEGTLGRLVNDESIANDIASVASSWAEGEGTLPRLMEDGTVYDNLLAVSEDLRDATGALRDREGTLGRILYEDDLYRDLQRALTTLNGSLEEAREAAPISTFLSTVFVGF